MRYTVYFIDDRYCEETVKAESPKEAAKIFFTQNLREYDCRINTGKGVFSAKELFPDMKFLLLDIEIAKLGCELNFNQLDIWSKDVLLEIYKHFPDWLSFAKHDANIKVFSPYSPLERGRAKRRGVLVFLLFPRRRESTKKTPAVFIKQVLHA